MFPRRRTLYIGQGNNPVRVGAPQPIGNPAPPPPVQVPAPPLNNQPPSPPPSPPPTPPHHGGGGVPGRNLRPNDVLSSYSDFQVCLTHEILEENFASNRVVRKVFGWMTRNRPGVRDRLKVEDYMGVQQTIEGNCHYKRSIFCSSCCRLIKHMNAPCDNIGCGRHGQRKNRMRANKMTIVDSVDLRKYVEELVQMNIEALVQSHGEIHQQAPSLEDIRFSPAVRENMETVHQYLNGVLVIPLAFYTDAFTFKGVQKGSSWPIMLSFLSLPPEMRQQLKNMLVPFMISSGSDPSMSIWRLIVVKLKRFLRNVRQRPLQVTSANGRRYVVRVIIPFHSMDLKAVCQLFCMAGWAGYNGCPRCLLRGHQHGRRGLKWPTGQNSPSRTLSHLVPGGVFHDATRRINGFRGVSPFLQLFSPTKLLPDPLHCLAEGLLKDFWKGATEGGGRNGLVLTPGGRATIQLLSSSAYVSLNSRVILIGATERLMRDVARYSAFRNEGALAHVVASQRLLGEIVAMNTVYFEYTQQHTLNVVMCSQIVAPLTVLHANGRHFAVNMLSQTYHE